MGVNPNVSVAVLDVSVESGVLCGVWMCLLFGMVTRTLPALTFRQESLLDWSVITVVCPLSGKVTVFMLGRKRSSLTERKVYFVKI